jgi:hypothetical protein
MLWCEDKILICCVLTKDVHGNKSLTWLDILKVTRIDRAKGIIQTTRHDRGVDKFNRLILDGSRVKFIKGSSAPHCISGPAYITPDGGNIFYYKGLKGEFDEWLLDLINNKCVSDEEIQRLKG